MRTNKIVRYHKEINELLCVKLPAMAKNEEYLELRLDRRMTQSNDFVTVQVIWNSGIPIYLRCRS